MPQMMPMNWMVIPLFMFMLIFTIMVNLYFCSSQKVAAKNFLDTKLLFKHWKW
uniref:ATP synthase F0 subunit 8 n=1 Tax=Tanystylum orbiculare TaxID=88027 RepID=E0XLE3_TANOR|nr:ATP synthase F0 subunit 8 [Tanystylum orbiculare]ADB91988.1 ATP synthase F0 subunit 8 [Tanystylum orbiculare]